MSGKTARLKQFVPVLIFAGIAFVLSLGIGMDPQRLPSPLIGKLIPEFQLSVLGEPKRILSGDDLPTEPFLLNVWASWCPSCVIEHPLLLQLAAQGVPIIGLNYKDDPEAAQAWLAARGDPYYFSLADPRGRLALDLGVYGAPETFFFDRERRVLYKRSGVLSSDIWAQDIAPLLAVERARP